MLSKILSVILVFIMISCGGILMKKQYSDSFLKEIRTTKDFYSNGDFKSAFAVMERLDDNKLSSSELSMKYNMVGFLFFSQKKYDQAITEFKKALGYETPDRNLQAQVNLNLASSYFKLNDHKSAFVYVTNVSYSELSGKDFDIFTKLYYILAKEVNESYDIVKSLILKHKLATTLDEVQSSQYSSVLKENYFQIANTGRMRLLEEFEGQNNFAVAFLGLEEAKKSYYSGEKATSRDVLQWLKEQFVNNPAIISNVESFLDRMQSFAQLNFQNIGVVLPLSGKKSVFGIKALNGIDTAIARNEKKFSLFVKDSKNSEIVATMAVRELVEKHYVSFIIGGLFPSTAKDEYLEAKKYGVIFISLSPIYLPKDQKNHLLIEIPGSIESQVNSVFSEKFLSAMGTRVAVLYPNSEGGEAYVNELWRLAKSKNVTITSIHEYDKDRTDFRDPVQKLLGLYFKREREEEYNLWNEVYSLKKSTVRRIQVLGPVIDFDWVFVPSFPKEAMQIIPSFSYYDAKSLNFVGGPSWRSRKILSNYKSMGKMYFIGENFENKKTFTSNYVDRYRKAPKLLETLSYDATVMGLSILDQEYSTREELESSLTTSAKIKGLFGEWDLVDGIWLKRMDPLTFYGGKILEANLIPKAVVEEIQEQKSNQ